MSTKHKLSLLSTIVAVLYISELKKTKQNKILLYLMPQNAYQAFEMIKLNVLKQELKEYSCEVV